MPHRLPQADLLATLDTEAARLALEADRVLPSDPVPTCPGWTVRDLVTHIGGVHRWAAAIVTQRRTAPTDDVDEFFEAPDDDDGLLPWFVDGSSTLIRTLRAAPDDLSAFVFLKNAPPAKTFWTRRQAHETTIHRVDAQSTRLGRMPTTAEAGIPTPLAVDGLDELLTGFVPRRSSRLRTDEPFRTVVAATDAPAAWTVSVSADPPVVVEGEDPAAHSRLTGTAAALYLGLWNRGDDVAEFGTVDLLGHWREQVRVTWA
ncbi:maleylpyruvate isomerase family mycothiol-dependent enzyme [Nakamurella sp.]|uniref:maleylpyruvate isomerase family mycothiol-dependent enzyme n=1 Tax=Nakamurella sp. TaxID=1869182 RepID=UPI003783FA28